MIVSVFLRVGRNRHKTNITSGESEMESVLKPGDIPKVNSV